MGTQCFLSSEEASTKIVEMKLSGEIRKLEDFISKLS